VQKNIIENEIRQHFIQRVLLSERFTDLHGRPSLCSCSLSNNHR